VKRNQEPVSNSSLTFFSHGSVRRRRNRAALKRTYL